MFLKFFGLILISLLTDLKEDTETESKNCNVEVIFNNLRNNKGELAIAIFNHADGFPEDSKKVYISKKITINDAKHFKFNIELPKNGTYAIAILHDENKNGKLDSNFFGVPKEGYGFSNNKTGALRAPSFNDCAFSTKSNNSLQLEILLKYW